ncbi:MAG: enoyl-ACP reductase [Acidobacteria bacterium]|nr:MAG: enoyl-ACP reductase [Acidobacteriota bacterium]RPJ84691.1 MAG: enoyl-ACP reductase [Acidobacteriota bacterium]
MLDLTGTHAVIVGVANRRSIAWAIAQALESRGTRLALTYADERLAPNVRELAGSLEHPLVLPCDVTNDRELDDLFEAVDLEFGGLDFLVHAVAFAPRQELAVPFVETTRNGFRVALDVSVYSLIALARRSAPLLARRGGGSILTLSYLGAARVFPNYNVMGVAKAALEASVRYLAADLGRFGTRVNAISAGPIKTLASTGISGFSEILQVYRRRAPLKRNIDASEVAEAAVFLLSSAAGAITGEVLVVDAGFHAMGI